VLPESVLSTAAVVRPFIYPRNIPKRQFIDFEHGGIALNDPSDGLRARVWRGEFIEGEVILSAEGVTPFSVLAIAGDLFDFGFSFDQNMNPFVCWELLNGNCFFYWFDSLVSGFVTTQLPAGSVTPRCALDDTRDIQVERGASDIILAYCRGGSLYFRAERERYQTENLLSTAVGERGLIQIGMNIGLRFQFQLSTAST
jgi:hypothetical protein